MVEVHLYVEAYASMRLSFLHEIGSKTMQSGLNHSTRDSYT